MRSVTVELLSYAVIALVIIGIIRIAYMRLEPTLETLATAAGIG